VGDCALPDEGLTWGRYRLGRISSHPGATQKELGSVPMYTALDAGR
jgi:hypothetical protein